MVAIGLVVAIGLATVTSGAAAQPADCPAAPAPQGSSLPLAIDLAGRPGTPSGVTGQALIAVPMQAPRTDCGQPSTPADVLHGEPGDLLRGNTSQQKD